MKKNYLLILMLLLFLFACKEEDAQVDDGSQTESTSAPQLSSKAVVSKDEVGDATPGFIDLEKMSFDIVDGSIVVYIQVVDMPDKLTHDHTALDVNHQEYEWTAQFDLGNDQSKDGDVSISVKHFKFGDDQQGEDALLDFAQVNVWSFAGTKGVYLVPANAVVENNVIKLWVDQSAAAELKTIDRTTSVSYLTTFNDGVDISHDISP